MHCEASHPRWIYVTRSAQWKYVNEHQGKLSLELCLTSNLGGKLLRERKPSVSTSNWKWYPGASSSKDRFCQIPCSTDPKAALPFLLHLLAQVLVKCALEKVFILSQNNHGEHYWSSIKICFKHCLLGVTGQESGCEYVVCGLWVSNTGDSVEMYGVLCQRADLAEGSYACTHGKCMWPSFSLCIHFSLDLISLCTQVRVFLCLCVCKMFYFFFYVSTLPQNS